MTKREQWEWIQANEPQLAALLLALKEAEMTVQALEWMEGGPEVAA